MAKATTVGGLDDNQVKNMMESLWEIEYNCKEWLPKEIYEWVKSEATILGVPQAYVAIPLVVATGHLAQHTKIEVDASHY